MLAGLEKGGNRDGFCRPMTKQTQERKWKFKMSRECNDAKAFGVRSFFFFEDLEALGY